VTKKTILIADDSASMRTMLISAIELMDNYRIVEATSGFEALRLLPHENVDLILTDINMPDINGLELLSYLRNNPIYSNVPVIIISTEGSQKDIDRGRLLGANDYLVKPVDISKLRELVRFYLEPPR
jgi:two-component system, chemotaxis family, chemotaxis protein CheY